jgi:N utilization substance protein B
MPSRHRSRERALQLVFQWDLNRASTEQVKQGYWESLSPDNPPEGDPFAEQLFQGVTARVDEIDSLIREHASNWKLERMSAVDRNILRTAIFEMLDETAAPAVIINEAIEIARRFSGDESGPFINGILDAVRRSLVTAKAPSGEG